MRIGTENAVLRFKFGEEKSLRLIAEAGFECVDYSLFNELGKSPDWLLADDYLESAKKTRRLIAKNGLVCSQTHVPFRLQTDAPRDESNPDYLGILRGLEYSGMIGAPCAVVHALTPPRGMDAVQYNIPFYMGLVPFARKAGVKIAVENLFKHDEYLPQLAPKLYMPSQFIELFAALPEDCFTVCLDTGHSAICGWEPEEFLRAMPKKMVTVLHIQDNNRLKDLHLAPFLSELHWDEFAAALKDYGFDGVFNMELYHFYKRMPEELLPDALHFAAKIGRYIVGQIEK